MPASDPMLSSSAMRAHFPSTIPLIRKMTKNSTEFCASGESNLPAICGARCDVTPTAIGIAMR